MSLLRIADALGLSITTVSRALAGHDDVAAATKSRVQAEAARIAYRPNHRARQFRSGRTGAIGIVLPAEPGQFSDPFFLQLLAAIGPRLADADLELLVTAARPGEDELRAHRHLVEGRRVDGILLARTRADDARITYLLDQAMPFVAHGRSLEPRPCATVDIDCQAAFHQATTHLMAQGHRHIALINAPEAYMSARHRQSGWHQALRDAALAPGPLTHVEPTEENGHRATTALLPAAPTAILCATDRLAVGCLHALSAAGRQDIAVIGHDDLPIASYTNPGLTTFAQPIAQAATHMVALLLAQLNGAPVHPHPIILQSRLIIRTSDRPQARETARAAAKKPSGDLHERAPENRP